MLTIAKHQIKKGLRDAKFLFMATLVLLAFLVNAVVYSERYHVGLEDYEDSIRTVSNELEENKDSLLDIANYPQRIIRPPSPLTFIADGGDLQLPNSWNVNAFRYIEPEVRARSNEKLPILAAIDWSFIVGTLMTLLTVLISFGAVCGEKRDGTLRLLLSNPISRMQLFVGKYVGLLVVILITFFVCISLNIGILALNGVIPLEADVVVNTGWVILLSILCLSLVLLIGMAVSSIVRVPAIALVILIIGWILTVVAVPGVARMIAEKRISIRSNYELERELVAGDEAIRQDLPRNAGRWNGDPFAEWVKNRALYRQRYTALEQRLVNGSLQNRIRQARLINTLSFISPSGLLTYALQDICDTGIAGFENSMKLARRYQQQLHDYTVARDRLDPDSPHHIYSWGTRSDPGVFSTKPAELNTVPRFQALLSASGLSLDQKFPWLQLVLFLAANLQMAVIAFFALLRYDPR